MYKIITLTLCLIFSKAYSQAHLGATETAIKKKYPEKVWEKGTTIKGSKYISTDMIYGDFTYYFDIETGLSNFCMQIPFNAGSLNAQVEAYNKKYVITSDTSWTAYLDEGGIMYIKLKYSDETKLSAFIYTSTK